MHTLLGATESHSASQPEMALAANCSAGCGCQTAQNALAFGRVSMSGSG